MKLNNYMLLNLSLFISFQFVDNYSSRSSSFILSICSFLNFNVKFSKVFFERGDIALIRTRN